MSEVRDASKNGMTIRQFDRTGSEVRSDTVMVPLSDGAVRVTVDVRSPETVEMSTIRTAR